MTKPSDAFKPLIAAVNEVLEVVKKIRDSLLKLSVPHAILHTPNSHSYLPGLDLFCLFKGCGLGPEEHPFTPMAHIHRPSPYYFDWQSSFYNSFCLVCGEKLDRVSQLTMMLHRSELKLAQGQFVLVSP